MPAGDDARERGRGLVEHARDRHRAPAVEVAQRGGGHDVGRLPHELGQLALAEPGAVVELGVRVPGAHEHHVHAGAPRLLVHRVGEAVHERLGRAVGRARRVGLVRRRATTTLRIAPRAASIHRAERGVGEPHSATTLSSTSCDLARRRRARRSGRTCRTRRCSRGGRPGRSRRRARASTAATPSSVERGRRRAPRPSTPCAARELGRRAPRAGRRRGRRARGRGRAPASCDGEGAPDPGRRAGDERGRSQARRGPARRRPSSASASTGVADLRPRRSRGCGSFSPWPVTVHTTTSSAATQAVGRGLQQAGDRRRRRRLDEARPRRRRAAGTRRGSRASVTAPIAPPDSSRAAIAPSQRRRVADADRGGDRLGMQHRLAEHERRRRPRPASRACAALRRDARRRAYSA